MRQLASIRNVRDVRPIEGADVIVAIQVDGWQCVSKKGEFNKGDMGVYFEIDSFLPETDARYSFLSNKFTFCNGKKGARIRTIKLKGQLSQGLMLPVSLFPEIVNPEIGQDVTELLGIDKWEPNIPAQLAGEVTGPIRGMVSKSDQERIQNLIDVISDEIAGKTFEQSVKLDGSSMTVIFERGVGAVASRNWELRETEGNTLWKVARRNRFIEAMEKLGRNIALQGEIMGEGIQGNNEGIKGQEFYLYNIWDIDRQCYVSPQERTEIVNQLTQFGATIAHVPILDKITFSENVTVEDILAMADGKSLFAPNREGLVFKREDGKFSFKAISNWYLQKYADR